MKFKVGIVGCGKIAGIKDNPNNSGYVGSHALAYYKHPLFELKAVACPEYNKDFQRIWKIPNGYKTIEELLKNEKLDVISVCTPTKHHYSHLKKILQSDSCPKVIFAEKPICETAAELDSLKKMAKDANCKIIVNHLRRYDPGHIKVKELISSNKLGKFVSGRVDYYGGWMHNGCHLVDMLRMLFDENPEIESVSLGQPGGENDPSFNAKLKIADSPVDVIGFDKKYYHIYESDFRFENGRIFIQDFGRKINVEQVEINKINERVLAPFSDSPWKGLDSPMYHAVELICDYLKNNKPLSGHGVLLEEASDTMNILWQAREMYDNIDKKKGKK